MIVPPTNVRVMIATKPVDFRKGMDGLAAIVEGELKLEPYSGVINVFRAKRSDRVRLLFWDAPTMLNAHFAFGRSNFEVSHVVYEPLFSVNPEAELIPILAVEIPSLENGGRVPYNSDQRANRR